MTVKKPCCYTMCTQREKMASIIKRKNGWQVQIRKQGYPALSKCFDKKADADIWARVTESEMDRGTFLDKSEADKTTLGDILKRYLLEKSPQKLGYKPEKSRIRLLLNHPLANRPLSTLKSSDISNYKNSRLQLVSGTTINKELNLLAKVIDTARIDWSINTANPVRMVSRPKNNRARDRRLHPGELERLLQATQSECLYSILIFAIETGLRRGEIANAKWADLNRIKHILNIPETKTGVPRQIPLSRRAIEVLDRIPKRDSTDIFGLRPESISQAFDRACLRAGIRDLHFHDLRHEAISRLFEKGFNVMEVATISGHKTLQMLQRYTHLRAENLLEKLG